MAKPVRIAAMAPSVPRNPKAEAQHARAVATSKQSPKVTVIRGKPAEREMAEMQREAKEQKAKGKR